MVLIFLMILEIFTAQRLQPSFEVIQSYVNPSAKNINTELLHLQDEWDT